MYEKIKELYDRLRVDTASFMMYQDRMMEKKVYKNIPQIQEFVIWFLEKNQFGFEDKVYQDMCQDLLNILSDLLKAMEQHDQVIINDTLAYGFMNYLELINKSEKEDQPG